MLGTLGLAGATKATGAAGKVLKLSIEGTKLRALVQWTSFGQQAIRERGFAYLWVLLLVPGWIAWTLISIWFLYRVVRGWLNLSNHRAMP